MADPMLEKYGALIVQELRLIGETIEGLSKAFSTAFGVVAELEPLGVPERVLEFAHPTHVMVSLPSLFADTVFHASSACSSCRACTCHDTTALRAPCTSRKPTEAYILHHPERGFFEAEPTVRE